MSSYIGNPFPLGATWDGKGVNFALYSENATAVELCLYDENNSETARIKITECSGYIWHVYLPDAKPCQLYAYRVHGPFEPEKGHRFNNHKLLLDPYAKSIAGSIINHPSLYAYKQGDENHDLSFNEADSAPHIPKCVVIDPAFDWGDDKPPKIPFHESIIYEAHVKGLTCLHPGISDEQRGKYAAISHPAMISYYKELGITAVELLPVHHYFNDINPEDKKTTNYWCYNTIGFLAPDSRFSASGHCGEQIREFKQMVKDLHKGGLEVILDVVYNHTGEGNQMGPTICFRGIDNVTYYRVKEDDKRYYFDYTGTGNTLNANLPNVLRLIMDSLRYWVLEMHVDGFRFDLAATLARELHEVDRLSSFFDIIHQDPVLSQVKLIAEPWDIGEGGYQVGNFPPGWSEWNGKYRDCMRDYWRGAESMLGEFAERFTGSSDLYMDDGRRPTASINFITAHDGFTLNDLVSYNEKHNEANGENNKDGDDTNRSWNCGAEGPTEDPAIAALRKKQQRNFLTTLFLSQGVPMLVAGDEFGRTQNGNNNAYNQDNEISWVNWEKMDQDLLEFTKAVIRIRKHHPVFRRRKWFQGQAIRGVQDIAWFLPDGNQMGEDMWKTSFAKSLAVYFNGNGIQTPGLQGEKITDDSFYVIFNASHEAVDFTLPPQQFGGNWKVILSTNDLKVTEGATHQWSEIVKVEGRSILLMQQNKQH